jgi:hypothetical protein
MNLVILLTALYAVMESGLNTKVWALAKSPVEVSDPLKDWTLLAAPAPNMGTTFPGILFEVPGWPVNGINCYSESHRVCPEGRESRVHALL